MWPLASEINDDDEQDTARDRDRDRDQKSNIAYKNNNITSLQQ
jgi:hypothetical protein